METFIRLFVNHRPVYGIGNNDIEDAFKALAGDSGGVELPREELESLLKTEGESFGTEELEQALLNLVGKKRIDDALKSFVTADEFASDLLGFEEYEEGDDEQDVAGAGAEGNQTSGMASGGAGGGMPEVIPEVSGF